MIRILRDASRIIFEERQFQLLFVVLWTLFGVGIFFLPIDLNPTHTVALQANFYTLLDWILVVIVSALAALSLSVQMKIFVLKVGSRRERAGHFAIGGMGIIAAIGSSLFATASCALCVGALFSFLGVGAVVFLVEYRLVVLAGAIVLLFGSLYLASRRLVGGCEVCEIS